MFARFAAVVFLVSATLLTRCLAWNDEGHRIVALIAESRLTTPARQHVRELLGGLNVRELTALGDQFQPINW